MRRLILKAVLFGAIFCVLQKFCYRQTDGFFVSYIKAATPSGLFIAQSQVPEQRFHFLEERGGTYTCLSEDKQWLLKFFKSSLFQSEEDVVRLQNRYRIGYHCFRSETGIIELHLAKTQGIEKKLALVDKLGITHQIDLNTASYVVQKNVTPTFVHLSHLIEKGELESAKQSISSLFDLIMKRTRKGLKKKAPALKARFGFSGTQAVEIDLKEYSEVVVDKESPLSERELFSSIYPLKKWLIRKSPELLEHLNTLIYTAATADTPCPT